MWPFPKKSFQKKAFINDVRDLNVYYGTGSREAVYPGFKNKYPEQKYATIDDIFSIVHYLATTAARIKSYGYRNDQPEEIITKMMNRPSLTLSRYMFNLSLHTYILLNGEVFLKKNNIDIGVNRGSVYFELIPPSLMDVSFKNGEITGYAKIWNGAVVQRYTVDEIIHIKEFNPDPYDPRGLSRVKVLLRRITQEEALDDQLTCQMQNGGVNTIVFDKFSYENSPETINKRKNSFYNFLRNNANRGMPYFATGDMQAINLGSTAQDMQLVEALKIPFKKLCNAFGTSDIIFNDNSASTESNVKEKISQTYTNTILPNIELINDAIELSLGLQDRGINIEYDISEIPELQEDMQKKQQVLDSQWYVTPNQKLIAMGYDAIDNPLFDQPWIPQGMVPLEDYQSLPPMRDDFGDFNNSGNE